MRFVVNEGILVFFHRAYGGHACIAMTVAFHEMSWVRMTNDITVYDVVYDVVYSPVLFVFSLREIWLSLPCHSPLCHPLLPRYLT